MRSSRVCARTIRRHRRQTRALRLPMEGVRLLDVVPLSLGIETVGGGMRVLIEKNTPLLAATRVYAAGSDNHSVVTLHVLQGEANTHRRTGRLVAST